MTTRKIAYVPGLGLYAMPVGYDPSRITRDDATNDAAICGARAELLPLSERAVADMTNARDTAGEGYEGEATEKRLAKAEACLDATTEAWAEALRCADAGDLAGLRETLVDARRLAREWGDDGPERTALTMLDAGAQEAA